MHFEIKLNSTNHNAWTLVKHVAGTANKVAGEVDNVFYGQPKIVQPDPFQQKHPVLYGIGQGFIGLLAIVVFFTFIFTWENRIDRVKERIMR